MNEIYILKYLDSDNYPEIVVGESKESLEEFVKKYNEENERYGDCLGCNDYGIEVVDLESLSKHKTEKLF